MVSSVYSIVTLYTYHFANMDLITVTNLTSMRMKWDSIYNTCCGRLSVLSEMAVVQWLLVLALLVGHSQGEQTAVHN